MPNRPPSEGSRIKWTLAHLDELTSRATFDIFLLRQQVFVLEQSCLYPDIDGIDLVAFHLLGRNAQSALLAYLRIIPPLGKYPGPAIGRVLTSSDARGGGMGRQLMVEGISRTRTLYARQTIYLSAQTYLLGFYTSLGFAAYGDAFDEDGIEHIQMSLGATTPTG